MRLNLHFTTEPMRTQGHLGTIEINGETVVVVVTMADENSIYSYFRHPDKALTVWCRGDIRGQEFSW